MPMAFSLEVSVTRQQDDCESNPGNLSPSAGYYVMAVARGLPLLMCPDRVRCENEILERAELS